jgi:hypothetical protein
VKVETCGTPVSRFAAKETLVSLFVTLYDFGPLRRLRARHFQDFRASLEAERRDIKGTAHNTVKSPLPRVREKSAAGAAAGLQIVFASCGAVSPSIAECRVVA